MRTSTRWTLLILAVVAVIIAALRRPTRRPHPTPRPRRPARIRRDHRCSTAHAENALSLAEPRKRADLPPCPVGADNPGPPALRGVLVECAADGAEIDTARALAGRPVVLNLWAYWCAPCAEELPAMAEYQRRVGSAVTVVTVHQDENEGAGLRRLADLGVRLPTFQDGSRRLAAALRGAECDARDGCAAWGRYRSRNPAARLRRRRRNRRRGRGGVENDVTANGDDERCAAVSAAVPLAPDIGPTWLRPLVDNVAAVRGAYRRRVPAEVLAMITAANDAAAAAGTKRDAAVLVLFSGPARRPGRRRPAARRRPARDGPRVDAAAPRRTGCLPGGCLRPG